jgi:hypothetical protein
MIRDCTYYAIRADLFERLAEIVQEIERGERILEAQLQDAFKYKRAWTDPRTGITYFPPKGDK